MAATSNATEPVRAVEGLLPTEVVAAQMQALSVWHDDPEAAAVVFQHASPANKAVTGPLPRFRELVERDSFAALTNNLGWTVGKAVYSGDAAVVLVTLVSLDDSLHAYRFYLSRQSEAAGRWMTDAVIPMALPKPAARSAVAPSAA